MTLTELAWAGAGACDPCTDPVRERQCVNGAIARGSFGRDLGRRWCMGRIVAALKHRARLRAPALWARVAGELPLHDISDLFGEVPPKPQAIPNRVHVTWATPHLGKTHAANFAAFRHRNADYAFRFYDDAAIHAFMRDHFADHPILPVFERARFGPLKTDIWRYCVLWIEGGVYCDIGKGLDTPLHQLLAPDDEGIVSFERNEWLSPVSPRCAQLLTFPGRIVINWAMMFAPRHPLLGMLINGIAARYPEVRGISFEQVKPAIIDFTGPGHLTRCVHRYVDRHGLAGLTQKGIDFDNGALLEMPGAWVRYSQRRGYALSHDTAIVD